MSLFGRNIIDRVKRTISHRLSLPVPPYQNPAYWEKVYSKLDDNDVFEWGDIDFETNLKTFTYKTSEASVNEIKKVYSEKTLFSSKPKEDRVNADFHQALFNGIDMDDNQKSILVLGCGNSRLGEDILHYYLDNQKDKPVPSIPKVIQCDISTHVVNSMTKRYHKYIEKDMMLIIQDDARESTLFNDQSVDAVVDKGLVDALFCTDRYDMMVQIMNSAHRMLKAGRVFMFFSFSKPEFLLKHTRKQQTNHETFIPEKDDTMNWKSVDVWELDQIYLYRFVKSDLQSIKELKPKLEKKRKLKKAMKKNMRK